MSSKCSFAQTKMKFVGHVIEHGRIRMDPAKVQAIQEWQPPTNVSELRSFLGLANYYRKFVIDYSKIALPLTELLKKSKTTWDWAGECQSAKPTLYRIISKGTRSRTPIPFMKTVTSPEKRWFVPLTSFIRCGYSSNFVYKEKFFLHSRKGPFVKKRHSSLSSSDSS